MTTPKTVVLPDGKHYIRADDYLVWEHGLKAGTKPPKSLRNSLYNRCSRGSLPSRLFRGRRYILWED